MTERSIKLINSDGGDGRMSVCFVLSEKNESVSSGSSLSPYLALSVMSGLFQGLRQEKGCAVATAPASTPAMGLLQLHPSGRGRGFSVGVESKVITCPLNNQRPNQFVQRP